jgi:hypothetical protein
MEQLMINAGDIIIALSGLLGAVIVAIIGRVDHNLKERIFKLNQANSTLCNKLKDVASELQDYRTMTDLLITQLEKVDPQKRKKQTILRQIRKTANPTRIYLKPSQIKEIVNRKC